jgi:hypothetical protein
MGGDRKKQSFWITLPGILTALAAVITAVTGLIIGLYTAGLIGGDDGDGGVTSPTNTPSVRATPSPGETSTPAQELAECFLEDLVVIAAGPEFGEKTVSWDSTGDCDPFEGVLTASYVDQGVPYAEYQITEPRGNLIDEPAVRCEGTFDITYTLTFADQAGRTLEAVGAATVLWIC